MLKVTDIKEILKAFDMDYGYYRSYNDKRSYGRRIKIPARRLPNAKSLEVIKKLITTKFPGTVVELGKRSFAPYNVVDIRVHSFEK